MKTSTLTISLPTLLTAYARAAETSALAKHALAMANLAALPSILQGMGRPMSLATQAAWLAAVMHEDVLTIRNIAVGLASARVGVPRGPHVALLEAIVDATGSALMLRDTAEADAHEQAQEGGGAVKETAKMLAPCSAKATAPAGFDLVVNGTVVTSPASVVAGDVIVLRQKVEGGGDVPRVMRLSELGHLPGLILHRSVDDTAYGPCSETESGTHELESHDDGRDGLLRCKGCGGW